MSLAAIDNRIGRTSVFRKYDSSVACVRRMKFLSPYPACRAAGPGPFFYSPGCDRACCYRSLPAAIDPSGTLPYAGQVVRRVLLRRNIVIDAETAQLVAAAMQAALQAGEPSRRPGREPGFPARAASRRPDNGSCPDPWNSSITPRIWRPHRPARWCQLAGR